MKLLERRLLGVAVATVLLAVPLLFGTAAASPPTGAAALTVKWAYGAEKWVNASGTTANGTLTASGFFGWHMILSQGNTSKGIAIEVNRTMGATLSARYCTPDCTNPIVNASLNVREWEHIVSFVNLTLNGTVDVNGTQVPAVAITDTESSVAANYSENSTASLYTMFGGLRTSSGAVNVRISGHDAVAFAPALGLYPSSPGAGGPWSLGNGAAWSSESEFNSSGAWSAFYSVVGHRMNGAGGSVSANLGGSLTDHGSVLLNGSYENSTALNNGAVVRAVALALSGPFVLRDGIVFLPSTIDAFGESHQPWESNQTGRQFASTAALDIGTGIGHFPLLAAATDYSAAPSSPSLVASAPRSGPQPAASPSAAAPAARIQGQPESVDAASTGSQCLVTASCTGTPSTPLGPRAGGVAVLVLAVVALAVLAVALIASRRRSVPPPANPHASLYPTGTSPVPPPSVTGSVPVAPPRPGESPPDPLDNLW